MSIQVSYRKCGKVLSEKRLYNPDVCLSQYDLLSSTRGSLMVLEETRHRFDSHDNNNDHLSSSKEESIIETIRQITPLEIFPCQSRQESNAQQFLGQDDNVSAVVIDNGSGRCTRSWPVLFPIRMSICCLEVWSKLVSLARMLHVQFSHRSLVDPFIHLYQRVNYRERISLSGMTPNPSVVFSTSNIRLKTVLWPIGTIWKRFGFIHIPISYVLNQKRVLFFLQKLLQVLIKIERRWHRSCSKHWMFQIGWRCLCRQGTLSSLWCC